MTVDVTKELFEPGQTVTPSSGPVGNTVREGEQDPEAIIDVLNSIQTLPEEKAVYHRDRPPALRLPGFGEPRDDCGTPNPATIYPCVRHAHSHNFNRNCLQYDCPMHWRHAVRRRAAGSADASGVCPQLQSLVKWLGGNRDEHQRFHHLVFSPPDDINVYADDVLKRLFQACRQVMDRLGVQGLVAYHPWRHEKEDWEADSIGDWPPILNLEDWGDAKDELSFEPHFHIVAVGHEALDYSITEQIEAETEWVLHRIENEEDNAKSISGLFEMCAVVTYVLSHAGLYKTDQQTRLAAAMKGPDVNDVTVYADTAIEVEDAVGRAAIKTLGIEPTDLTCQADVPPDEYHLGYDDGLPDFLRASEQLVHPAAGESTPVSKPGGLSVSTQHNPRDTYIQGDVDSHHSGVGAMASAPSDLDDGGGDGFGSGGSSDGARADRQTYGDGSASSGPLDDDDPADPVERTDQCGAKLIHISQASEFLLSRPEWREMVDTTRVEHLDRLYRDYVSYLEAEDLGHDEARPMVTEERHGPGYLSDRDEPPDD